MSHQMWQSILFYWGFTVASFASSSGASESRVAGHPSSLVLILSIDWAYIWPVPSSCHPNIGHFLHFFLVLAVLLLPYPLQLFHTLNFLQCLGAMQKTHFPSDVSVCLSGVCTGANPGFLGPSLRKITQNYDTQNQVRKWIFNQGPSQGFGRRPCKWGALKPKLHSYSVNPRLSIKVKSHEMDITGR
jgi:hypothetical protein